MRKTDGETAGATTLALDVSALAALANPRAAVADARGWSRHVGVVAAEPAAATEFVATHRIRQDFVLGELDARSVLSKLRWEADTDRFVYVGATADQRALAEHVGWEYVPIAEAAEAADWTLAEEAGWLDRSRAFVGRLLPWQE